MSKIKRLPKRSQVKTADRWDLSDLYPDDDAWETAFVKWEKRIGNYAKFSGTLAKSAKILAGCLKFDLDFERTAERLGVYAFLKTTEDAADSTYQRMQGRFHNAASRAAQAASYIRPEIMAIPAAKMKKMLSAKELANYRLLIERLLRFKRHTLSKGEEKLLAMQSEMASTAGNVFGQLNNADLKFGTVKNDRGEVIELSHGSLATCLNSPSRRVRKTAFHQYYAQYDAHVQTLAATLSGSIQRDVFNARARGYESSLARALAPDYVPRSVYDNLISAVHRRLPTLHRYYDVRRRKMKLKEIHHYDTYVPILVDRQTRHSWSQAVKLVTAAVEPLGSDYCDVLQQGLSNGWCDRYENRGKQSGAFSCGWYGGHPYILMNYQADVLDHVFTLAHEAGHAMHSHLSAKHQPFTYYDYTIFVAEVASTVNEQLLTRHLMAQARDDRERAFLVNKQIDDIRGTILRQTMFAEFEKITHELAEANEPLTVEAFKTVYRDLLDRYFGPEFNVDEELSLECFRIPHFYRAFYVYKYATGLSAAITLAQRVTDGGRKELKDYLGFLQGGCSQDPLDLLRGAGVDLEKPTAVEKALDYFDSLVDELDGLL